MGGKSCYHIFLFNVNATKFCYKVFFFNKFYRVSHLAASLQGRFSIILIFLMILYQPLIIVKEFYREVLVLLSPYHHSNGNFPSLHFAIAFFPTILMHFSSKCFSFLTHHSLSVLEIRKFSNMSLSFLSWLCPFFRKAYLSSFKYHSFLL